MNVSSPDKVMYADGGITKADVVAHYERVGDRMLEFARGRPLTLQRFPRGIDQKGFMQKNAADHFPASIRRLPVPKRGGGTTLYPVVDDPADLAWLANQNTITFHMWTSTADTPGRPDWLVIDLDPEEGDVAQARSATFTVRSVLASFDLDGFVLATGSKGFHVWVPLDGSLTFGEVSLASRAVAGLAELADPDSLTMQFLKRDRGGRVFVDWLRNGPIATVVVPFSLRPLPGAPVAVPIGWDELATATPDGVTLGSLDLANHELLIVAPQALPVDEITAAARNAGVDLDTPHDRFGR